MSIWVAVVILFSPDGSYSFIHNEKSFNRYDDCYSHVSDSISALPSDIMTNSYCIKVTPGRDS